MADPSRAAVGAFNAKLMQMVQSSVVLATAAVADRIGLFALLREHSNPSNGVPWPWCQHAHVECGCAGKRAWWHPACQRGAAMRAAAAVLGLCVCTTETLD